MGLKGEFPLGVLGCSSRTGFDISSNSIYGNIPNNISRLLGYITTIDLSSNQLSGEIPSDIANCSYLNLLKLDDNHLTGQIRSQIGLLNRMKAFSVTGNRLNGPVPHFINATFSAESYANNTGLCGDPLPPCQAPSWKSYGPTTIGGTVWGLTISASVFSIVMFVFVPKMCRKKERDRLGNKRAKSIKGAKRIKASYIYVFFLFGGVELSMFEKSVSKLSLRNLMKTTNDFSKENIIGAGRTGTMYKAVLENGTSLMVKRLQGTQHSEKEFMSEMSTLGNVKHRSLVPLIGFCMTKKERFLVYKHMPNGTLNDSIHITGDGAKVMDWPLRLKIGLRAAKGFAWLHHSCNPRIIHRNISSKCIFLDSDYEPKISGFGVSRLMNPIDTHLGTFVNGEFGDLGYVAPEYARTLVATPKGDVCSFGVVLLELVTGEKPTFVANESFNGNLAEWISQLSTASKLHDAIDTSLSGKGFDSKIFQFLKVACSCILPGHKKRPTMFEVHQLLRAIGQRYDFTTEYDILMVNEACTGDEDQVVELIVA
ncbi:hypothetical protein BUALT_Bualt13G0110000 [Buddleja alternifolia]|uniref:Protein kinase domain-containing protein n=1 Tax=Buddleja alternifolia TaxID=168488 RepID=A0AAV6WXI1_9LAMI|nr:hypothetical protein BUALT_Bualt13G0110000 [Buddleja alternifolia]